MALFSTAVPRTRPARVIGGDLPSQLATFHITKNAIVEAIVGADPQSGTPGNAIAFPL